MSCNLHEDASGVGSKPRVNCLKRWPSFSRAEIPITTIEILIPQDPSLLRGVGIVSADLYGTNEICGLLQGLDQRGVPLFSQGELEMTVSETVQEGGVSHCVFPVQNQHRLLMEELDKFGVGLLWPLLDYG